MTDSLADRLQQLLHLRTIGAVDAREYEGAVRRALAEAPSIEIEGMMTMAKIDRDGVELWEDMTEPERAEVKRVASVLGADYPSRERGKVHGEQGPRAEEQPAPGSPEYMRRQMAAVDRDLAEHGVEYFLPPKVEATVAQMAAVEDRHDELLEHAATHVAQHSVESLAKLDIRSTQVPGHRQLLGMVILLARGIVRQQRQITRLQQDLDAVKNALDGIS